MAILGKPEHDKINEATEQRERINAERRNAAVTPDGPVVGDLEVQSAAVQKLVSTLAEAVLVLLAERKDSLPLAPLIEEQLQQLRILRELRTPAE